MDGAQSRKRTTMSRTRFLLALTIVLVLGWAGAGQLTRKERATPRALYENKCSKCHRLYEPKDYLQEEWRLWMIKMSQKANLSNEQEKLLNSYLDAYRTGKP
jgi:hypothetical protein